jgi:hypothetical protein
VWGLRPATHNFCLHTCAQTNMHISWYIPPTLRLLLKNLLKVLGPLSAAAAAAPPRRLLGPPDSSSLPAAASSSTDRGEPARPVCAALRCLRGRGGCFSCSSSQAAAAS